MMKRFSITAALTAVLIAALSPLQIHAEESDGIHVHIDNCILQPEEAASSREVPLYVTIDSPHVGITSVEFGIAVDERCSYNLVTDSDQALEIGGLPLSAECTIASKENFSWIIWAAAQPNTTIKTFIMVDVKLPKDAGYGDCYTVSYEDVSLRQKNHRWINVDEQIDYAEAGKVTWDDGYIIIAPVRGDVNLDQTVDIIDVIALNRFLLGASSLNPSQRYAAETDGNATIDSTDSLNVLKYVVDLIDTLEY